MPENPDAIHIAHRGNVYTAPIDETLVMPVNPFADLDSDFVDMGLIHEDGFTWRFDKTAEPIMVWGSFYAVKYRITDATSEQEFTLKQFDRVTLPFAMGGGAVTKTEAAVGPPAVPEFYTFRPGNPEDLEERALVIDWVYASSDYRLVVPRVMLTSGTELQFTDNSETDMPVTVGLMGTPGVDAYTLFTNDPAFAPAA